MSILTQEEFDHAFNGMGYDRLGTLEMKVKASHAALLARVRELEAEKIELLTDTDMFMDDLAELRRRIATLEAAQRWIQPSLYEEGSVPEKTQTEVAMLIGQCGRMWVTTATYMGWDDWRNPDYEDFKEFDIIAWQPFPPLPAGETA